MCWTARGVQGLCYSLQSAVGIATAATLADANHLSATFRRGRRLKPQALALFGIEVDDAIEID